MSLAAKRCFNHPGREVAIRCPECGHFYCRECASEFRDRFLCRACLGALSRDAAKAGTPWLGRWRVVPGFVCGVLVSWLIFYGLAQILYILPASLHSEPVLHEEEGR